jgi:hypothetical protein
MGGVRFPLTVGFAKSPETILDVAEEEVAQARLLAGPHRLLRPNLDANWFCDVQLRLLDHLPVHGLAAANAQRRLTANSIKLNGWNALQFLFITSHPSIQRVFYSFAGICDLHSFY